MCEFCVLWATVCVRVCVCVCACACICVFALVPVQGVSRVLREGLGQRGHSAHEKSDEVLLDEI